MQEKKIHGQKTKWKSTVINLLIAAVISLLVNFSYFVMMIMRSGSGHPAPPPHKFLTPIDYPLLLTIEVVYYAILALIILVIFTGRMNQERIDRGSYWKRLLIGFVVVIALYFFAPRLERGGNITVMFLAHKLFDPMVILKCSFSFVVAALYGKIYELLFRQQNIIVENERLKTENIRSRYDMLTAQVNPHFFFNSLNSLSMLVRENKNDDALTYIDRLSDTFRYILDTSSRTMTRLREELEFIEAYKYLFEIRYEGKFFVDINVGDEYMERTLPTLSLQPLLENAVKHNTITRSTPLHVSITIEDDRLVVSNPIQPKIESQAVSGIGLKNLSSRYMLMTGKDITVDDDGKCFTVKLPLGDKQP